MYPARPLFSKIKVSFVIAALLLLSACGSKDASHRYERGLKYQSEGDISRAAIEYQNALQQDPSHIEARYRLAQCMIMQNNRSAARQHLKKILDSHPDHLGAQIEHIPFYVQDNQISKAYLIAQEAVHSSTSDSRPLVLLSKALFKKQNLGEALDAAGQALAIEENKPETLVLRASICAEIANSFQKKSWQQQKDHYLEKENHWRTQAHNALQKVLNQVPDHPDARLLSAQLALDSGQVEQAEEYLKSTSDTTAPDTSLAEFQAELLMLKGLFSEATQYVKSTLDAGRKTPRLNALLAQSILIQEALARSTGQIQKADQFLESARLLLESENAQSGAMAYVLARSDQNNQAENLYELLLDMPVHAHSRRELLFDYALLSLSQGNPEKAFSLFNQLKASSPGSIERYRLEFLLNQAPVRQKSMAGEIYNSEGPAFDYLLNNFQRSLNTEDIKLQEIHGELVEKAAPASPLPEFIQATVLLQKETPDNEKCLKLLNEAAEKNEFFLPAFLFAAQVHIKQKHFQQALDRFQKALDRFPENADAIRGKAHCLLALKRLDEAVPLLDQMLIQQPGPDMALIFAAELRSSGNKDLLQDLFNRHSDSLIATSLQIISMQQQASLLLQQGEAAESRRLKEQARMALEAALQKNPSSVLLLDMHGALHSELGNFEKARQSYETILRLKEDFEPAYRGLIHIHLSRNDLSAALEICQKALSLWPGSHSLTLSKADILSRMGRWHEASQLLRSLVQSNPTNVQLLVALAENAMQRQDLPEATAILEGAVQFDATNPRLYLKLSDLYLQMGLAGKAETLLLQGEKKNPDASAIFAQHGRLLLMQNKLQEAEEKLRQTISMNPGEVTAVIALAELLQEQNRPDDLDSFRKELMESTHSDSPLALADWLRNRGQIEKAQGLYQAVYAQDAKSWRASAGLAQIAAMNRDKDQALQHYEEAIATAPSAQRQLLLMEAGSVASASWDQAPAQWKKDLGVAQSFYRQALQESTSNESAVLMRLARICSVLEHHQQELDYLNQLASRNPDNPNIQVLLASASEKLGNSQEAGSHLEKAVTLIIEDENPSLLLSRLGREMTRLMKSDQSLLENLDKEGSAQTRETLQGIYAFYMSGQSDIIKEEREEFLSLALNHFENLKQMRENSSLGYALKTVTLMQRENSEAVENELKAWLGEYPDNQPARLMLARFYANQDHTSRALEQLDLALQHNPDSIPALLAKSSLLSSTSVAQVDQAMQSLREGLEKHPGQEELVLALASLLKKENQLDEAARICEEFLRIKPNSLKVLELAGGLYLSLEDPLSALIYYRRAKGLSPQSPSALNNLAFAYAQSETNLDTAVALTEQALSRMPGHPTILDTLGYIKIKQKDYDSAVQTLKDALEKKPDNPVIHFHLAQALAGMDNRTDAFKHLNIALKDSSFPYKNEARRLKTKLQATP